MKGTVNALEMSGQGQNEKGPYTKYTLTVDQKAYTVFDDHGLKPGDVIEYDEYETTGKTGKKFKNIKNIKKVDPPKPEHVTNGYRGKSPEETAAINRAVALKAGLEWASILVDITSKAGEMPMTAVDLLRQMEAVVLRWEMYLRTGKTAPVPKITDIPAKSVADDEPPVELYQQDAERGY